MEQHSFRWIDTETFKKLWMSQRELNHLTDFQDLILQTTNILITYLGDPQFLLEEDVEE